MKRLKAKSRGLLVPAILLLALACAAGAVWTAYWALRFGLTPRAPLPPFQTGVRIVVVVIALTLLRLRLNPIERTTLVFAAIAAGSSALFGFGLRSTVNDVARLLFHFLAYALGALVLMQRLTNGGDDVNPGAPSPR